MHRWQGCALHAMLEQGFISASGSPLAGQPPEMRSRAPQFSVKGAPETALPKQSRKDTSEINQRLENWGARRAAFRPYFTKPKLDFA